MTPSTSLKKEASLLICCFLLFLVSSPPIIINSNPHLDFSQLNNSLLLHTANSSCQTLESPRKVAHQFQPVIKHHQQQQQKTFFKENISKNPLTPHYLPVVATSPKRKSHPPFVEYTVGHVQVFNQQPRPISLISIAPSGSKQSSPPQQANTDTKRHTIGCFGNSSPINALFNIICKENGINDGTSVGENMNNSENGSKQQQQPKKTNESVRQEHGTSNKMPAIRVKTPQSVSIKKGTQEIPQENVR